MALARNIINARREALRDNNVHENPEGNHLQGDESTSEDINTDNDSNLETPENIYGDGGDQGDNAIEETAQSRLAGWRTNDHVNDDVDNIDEVDTYNVNDSNSETNEIDSNENVDGISGNLESMSITNWSTFDVVDNNDVNSEDVIYLVDTNLDLYEEIIFNDEVDSYDDEVDNSDVNDESGNISDDVGPNQANTYDVNDDKVDNSDVNDDKVDNSDVNDDVDNNSDDVDNSDVNDES